MSTERDVRIALAQVSNYVGFLESRTWDYLDMAVIGQGATDVELIHRIEAEAQRLEELADLMRRADPDERDTEDNDDY